MLYMYIYVIFFIGKFYMNDTEINDIRTEQEFKGITFSKFKKTEAKKELLNSLSNGRIEHALHWSAEFLCCGCYIDLWDIILNQPLPLRALYNLFISTSAPRLLATILTLLSNSSFLVSDGFSLATAFSTKTERNFLFNTDRGWKKSFGTCSGTAMNRSLLKA